MNSSAVASRRGIAGSARGHDRRWPHWFPPEAQQPTAATGNAAIGHHQSAAAMGSSRAARKSIPDPDIIVIDPSFRQYCARHHRDPSRRDRVHCGRKDRRGRARASTSCSATCQGNTQFRLLWDDRRVSRSASRRTTATATRSTSRDASSRREDFFRRVVRWEHDGTMTVIADAVRRQAAEFAERPGAASRWQHLVHRSAVWRHAVGGPSGRCRRADAIRRACSIRASGARECRRDRRHEAANCRMRCIAGTRAGIWTR